MASLSTATGLGPKYMNETSMVTVRSLGLALLVGLAACKSQGAQADAGPPLVKSALISVKVSPEKRGGGAWDHDFKGIRELEPDPAVCIVSQVGERKCFPGGRSRPSDEACHNLYDCVVWNVPVLADQPFRVEVWDYDVGGSERICAGECSFGRTCVFGPPETEAACAVAIDDHPVDLATTALKCPWQAGGLCPSRPSREYGP